MWYPHKTVATVVEKDGLFLMVEELADGNVVFNQPAGHLEPDETLIEAAVRETREETGWDVEIHGFLGLYQYFSPRNQITYVRSCFVASPSGRNPSAVLDRDIVRVHWLDIDQIRALNDKLRSPIVLKVLDDYLKGQIFPLSVITSLKSQPPLAD